jgi:rhomboid protease GluP
LPLPIRWRWRFDRLKEKWNAPSRPDAPAGRPRLCPSCGTLVGASATKCHQCGASTTFSLAAASRSFSRLMPTTSPATYFFLTLSCMLYAVSLMATIRVSGFAPPAGGIMGIFNLGTIDGNVLLRLGESVPLRFEILQPWRLVTAIFLHGGMMHIIFNMYVLMDIGPIIEELYGSSRYVFLYVATGIGGFILSAFVGHFSVGGSTALLGLIGVMLAVTTGRSGAATQMLRGQLIKWLVYIAVLGFIFPGIDNAGHLGGFLTGFLLGKLMADREPATPEERKRADILGWGTGLLIAASYAFMLLGYFQNAPK